MFITQKYEIILERKEKKMLFLASYFPDIKFLIYSTSTVASNLGNNGLPLVTVSPPNLSISLHEEYSLNSLAIPNASNNFSGASNKAGESKIAACLNVLAR